MGRNVRSKYNGGREMKIEFDRVTGTIRTSLSDYSFIEFLLIFWAWYSLERTEKILAAVSVEMLSDKWLGSEGYVLVRDPSYKNDDSVRIIKVGFREWIVDSASAEYMRSFVEFVQIYESIMEEK